MLFWLSWLIGLVIDLLGHFTLNLSDFIFNLWLYLVYFALDGLDGPIGVTIWALLDDCFWFFGSFFLLNEELFNFTPTFVSKNGHRKLEILQLLLSPPVHSILCILRQNISLAWWLLGSVQKGLELLDLDLYDILLGDCILALSALFDQTRPFFGLCFQFFKLLLLLSGLLL